VIFVSLKAYTQLPQGNIKLPLTFGVMKNRTEKLVPLRLPKWTDLVTGGSTREAGLDSGEDVGVYFMHNVQALLVLFLPPLKLVLRSNGPGCAG
jgi:hypothetical protein